MKEEMRMEAIEAISSAVEKYPKKWDVRVLRTFIFPRSPRVAVVSAQANGRRRTHATMDP
jgi:hypothetical protein